MAAKKIEEFMIVNRRTGKALQAAGTDNGQVVAQAAPTGEDAQLWVQTNSRGPLKLINKASGKALDVVDGGVESGAWAHVWEAIEEAPSQQWEIVKVTATYKKLRNVQSGKVLDIVDMSEEDGAAAQLWDDVDGVGQQWKFVFPAEEKPATQTVTKAAKKPAKAASAAAEEKKPVQPVKEEAAAPAKEAVKPAEEAATPAKETTKPAPKAAVEAPKAPAEKPAARKTSTRRTSKKSK